ncbi:hypothetical protein ACROYT_G028827 [Oculina patagonica]
MCGNVAVKKPENHKPDSSHVSASSKLQSDVHANSKEAIVSAVSKDELCCNEEVEEDSHQSDSSHVSASSNLSCDVPVNVEGMALNSVQNSLEMCAKNKTEELSVSVEALASDEDTPDTMGYVRYYLRTAYQLLLRAMVRDPVDSPPRALESSIHQPQIEPTTKTAQRSKETNKNSASGTIENDIYFFADIYDTFIIQTVRYTFISVGTEPVLYQSTYVPFDIAQLRFVDVIK